jgi:predicted MFS family arabinose efflux permease
MAAWIGGLARDNFGDYSLAFTVAGITAVIGGFLALGIRRQTPTQVV